LTLATRRRASSGDAEETRKAALVVRVSTDRQAANPEGSLKTQLQRLPAHIDYKNSSGEAWHEAGVYELKAVSGKDSMRSQEYAELFTAIRTGRVNTILCTALERLCRSVSDFLWFFEFINEHGVEFVCLKQQYDTTTPQGKLFVTIMIALAEFEREQTAERTRDATIARAERGSGTVGGCSVTTSTPSAKAT
jgi:site-specific DNA recombinase